MSRTAVVQEWVATHGGSENVAEAIADVMPDPDILCLWRDDPHRFEQFVVHESFLAARPFLRKHKLAALPLMPLAWRAFDLSSYDRLVISSHLFAHHLGNAKSVGDASVHVYAHTPARYIWEPHLDDRGQGWLARSAAPALRRFDRSQAPAQTAAFATNSHFVRQRVQQAWGVDSEVIYPPVRVRELQSGAPWADRLSEPEEAVLGATHDSFVLGASRLVRYKRVEEAIRIGVGLGLPVVIAGAGPERMRIETIAADASVPVTFVDRPSNALLYALYEAATLSVFAGIEDFGIMQVESMALGTPTLVNRLGGARESVEAVGGGSTTDFRNSQDDIAAAHEALSTDIWRMVAKARQFDRQMFQERISNWILCRESG